MVKWADLTRPKDFGGLGFTDTRLMNKCLLSKLIIKLERGDSDICNCHARFLSQNRVLIACVPRIIYSTHTDQKCSQIANCHE
jgi:hypothetical protein